MGHILIPATPAVAGLPASAAAAVAQNQRAGHKVLILLGDDATFSESPVPPDATPRSTGRSVIAAEMDSAWWRDVDLSGVATVIVIVSTEAIDRRIGERTLRQLRDLNLPTYLVLQQSVKSGAEPAPAPTHAQPASAAPPKDVENYAT